MERTSLARPPVAIGGVGGSGTRLVARFLADLGFFLGADLNESYDNLWFTLLFKRREILQSSHEELADLVAIFRDAMTSPGPLSAAQLGLVKRLAEADRLAHHAEWLRHRALSLASWSAGEKPTSGAWGWKEPNTHVVLERLEPLLPGMKYIHVVRNGLDMAYSSNQTQLCLWGPSFLGLEEITEVSPRLSLKYWHAVHRLALDHRRKLGNRFLLLNYDRLCMDPEAGLGSLLHFLEAEPARSTVNGLLASIRPPESVGRFRQHPPSDFDLNDIAFARELGFDTDYGH